MRMEGKVSCPAFPRSARMLSPLRAEHLLFIGSGSFCLLILFLLVIVLWSTFQGGLPGTETSLTLQNYREVFLSGETYRAGLNSLVVAFGTVLVNLFFALPSAWLIYRTNLPFKTFFITLMGLGIVIPGFLKGIAWILLLSPKVGLLNQFLRNFIPVEEGPLSIYNLAGISFVQGLMLTPVMFFMCAAAFRAVDPQLEESAEACGAPPGAVFRRITAPLILPAIAGAAIYNFMTAVALFEIPALLGTTSRIQVLSTLMFYNVQASVGLPRYGVAGVYGILLLFPSLIAIYYYQKLLRQGERYSVVSGKGYRPKFAELGRWRYAAIAFVCSYLFLNLFLPFLVLMWTSLVPYIQLPSRAALSAVTLEGYRRALTTLSGRPLINTVLLAVWVPALVLFFSTITSWIVVRTRLRGRRGVDAVVALPMTIPHLAFAFALSYVGLTIAKGIPIYGSLAAIIISHSIAFISFGTRTVNGTLIQIHRELEEAVLTSGGSRLVALRRVVLPLLAPALFYTGVWVALLSYREVTMALFLQSPRNQVLSTAIWNLWDSNNPADAAAMGVLMFFTVMLLLVALQAGARGVLYGMELR